MSHRDKLRSDLLEEDLRSDLESGRKGTGTKCCSTRRQYRDRDGHFSTGINKVFQGIIRAVFSENQNILKFLFDIKPVDKTGRVDVGKITRVMPVVDLGNPSMRLRVNQKPAKNLNKKAPTDATSSILMNSVGAAYSTEFPGCHLIGILSQPKLKSSESVDNQKPRFGEVVGSVDGTGFAPVGSLVATQDRHYTPPTVKLSYQRPTRKENPSRLLEKYLNSKLSIKKELTAIGAKVEMGGADAKPRYRQIFVRQKFGIMNNELGITNQDHNSLFKIQDSESNEKYETALKQINERITSSSEGIIGEPREIYPFELTTSQVGTTCDVPVSPSFVKDFERAQPEIESWIRHGRSARNFQFPIRQLADNFQSISKFQIPKLRLPKLGFKILNKSLLSYFLTFLLVFIVLASFGRYGVNIKNEIVKESNSAVASLEQAEKSLKVFDFESASNNFAGAYEEFSKAGENLNFVGASITSLFAGLPGAGKLKSAKNLIEAGKLLAEAGKSMSEAVNSLAQTGAILKITNNQSPITNNIFSNLKKSLTISNKNLSKASALLSDISPDALPEGKRGAFLEFQSKLPELEGIVSDAVEYASFLERFLSTGLTTSDGRGTSDVTKKYLVLFQNDSELRTTGGFPGTYGVVTFKDGQLLDILVDDVYNLDGQLKENIIPPKQLQHITPTWGMRDANWFIDFSISAQKVMEFFKKEAGYEVDGVLTLGPGIISEILKVVGPVEMPEYGSVINDENFVSTIQEEIEYGDNRQQPKKIVMDMAPKLLEKISSADRGQWLDIFNIFVAGLDKKDILMYFKDLSLENFVAEKEFGGLVKNTEEDYLMVTFTNIKGSKTDRVTDNSLKLNSQFTIHNSQPAIKHKLTITRQHNGGDTKYGFYNKQNPAFVRVLVPKGTELISVSGNSTPNFRPLVSYLGDEFRKDKDLFKLESDFVFNEENNTWIYEESGKTGFAFWLITDPGKQKTVELEYIVPFDYASSFAEASADRQGEPYGIYIQKQPGLEVDNFEFNASGKHIYNREFDRDLEFKLVVDN